MKRQLDEDLKEVTEGLLDMARFVEGMLTGIGRGLEERDPKVARSVARADAKVDRMEREVDGLCHALLVRHQPTAVDHRLVTAVLKTTGELERIGDCAKNVAQAIEDMEIDGSPLPDLDLSQILAAAHSMVTDALKSFVEEDGSLAYQILERDDEVDDQHARIVRRVEDLLTRDPTRVPGGLRLLAISKNLERVADHATNVAENVIYFLEGRDIRHQEGPRAKPLPAGYPNEGAP